MGVSTLVLKCQSEDVLINFEYLKKKIVYCKHVLLQCKFFFYNSSLRVYCRGVLIVGLFQKKMFVICLVFLEHSEICYFFLLFELTVLNDHKLLLFSWGLLIVVRHSEI